MLSNTLANFCVKFLRQSDYKVFAGLLWPWKKYANFYFGVLVSAFGKATKSV